MTFLKIHHIKLIMCRYFYEKGQYSTALEMTTKGVAICEHALGDNTHPGYSEWAATDMISHLLNIKAAIAREGSVADHGVQLSRDVCKLRRENSREGDEEDEFWIAAAEGNLAVSLMAVGQAEEALEILLRLLDREDMEVNEDIYLSNTCLCLLHLGRLEEAERYGKLATEAVKRLRGDDTAQMAV